jgi:hypothetical protein
MSRSDMLMTRESTRLGTKVQLSCPLYELPHRLALTFPLPSSPRVISFDSLLVVTRDYYYILFLSENACHLLRPVCPWPLSRIPPRIDPPPRAVFLFREASDRRGMRLPPSRPIRFVLPSPVSMEILLR